MLRRVFFALLVGMGLLWLVDSAWAQMSLAGDTTAGDISGTAQIRLQAKPSKLRVQVQLRSYGLTVDAALKNLKSRCDAVTAQLKTFNADAKSISFSIARAGAASYGAQTSDLRSVGPTYAAPVPTPQFAPADPSGPTYTPSTASPPTATPALPPPATYTPDAVDARPSSERNPAAKGRPKLFVASTTLRADWPLEGDDADAIVAAAAAIREKVSAADLNGYKGEQALTPEEREYAEEAEMFLKNTPSSGFQVPAPSDGQNGFAFVYVARLSDQQRKTMLSNGYAKAKSEAEELAEAAGKQLGELSGLYCQFQNMCMPGRDFPDDRTPMARASWDQREAVAEAPDGLEFRCNVTVGYHILHPGAKP